jgi:glycosyltransferase involved in cell wall biosynthesis
MADLSVIVPLYNEEQSVRPLYDAVTSTLGPLGLAYELLLVDDGSSDNTFSLASALGGKDQRVRVIKFRRNYGQTAAMAAGIELARGNVLITMDGDLQNDPADIPNLLKLIDQGYDIVVGWRYDRKDSLVTRRIPSYVANWLIGKITGIPVKDNGCTLKAYRSVLIKGIPLYSDMHRFVPAIAFLGGARLAEIKVKHHPRRYGTSKYGLARIYGVLVDLVAIKMIVTFTSRPLLWFSLLALPAAVACILALLATTYRIILDPASVSIALAGTGVLFGALTIILLLNGILSELIYKTGDLKLEMLSFSTAQKLEPQRNGR